MRCLGPASIPVEVDAQEYEATDAGTDEDLDSEYVSDGELDVSAWARDQIAHGLPDQILCRSRLRRPVPDVRKGPERRAPRARRRGRRPPLGGARGPPHEPGRVLLR